MSRTLKDKKYKYTEFGKEDEASWEYFSVNGRHRIILRTFNHKRKKRKTEDTKYHWMTTPSWWTRMMMNRPQRHKSRMWEKEVVKKSIDSTYYDEYFPFWELFYDLEPPILGKKPHIYYW